MGQDDRNSSAPGSMPPRIDDIDLSWDDDQPLDESGEMVAAPAFDDERDDALQRVTAIPALPPEALAAELMAKADAAEAGAGGRAAETTKPGRVYGARKADADAALADGGVPPLPSEPPPLDMPDTPLRALSEQYLPTHGARRASSGNHFAPPDAATAHPPRAQAGRRPPTQDDLVLELDDSNAGPDVHDPVALPELELDIVEPGSVPGDASLADMKDRYAMGDFTGALVLAESILETSPGDPDATRYAESCREVLTQMYAARIGQLSQVPTVATPSDQIRWLSLDHRAGFLLSLVDGASSIEEILDISGMSRLDALRIMFALMEQRVIALEPGG